MTTAKITGVLSTKRGKFIFEYFLRYHPHLNADVYFFNIWREDGDPDDIKNFSFLLRVMENCTDLKVADLFANKYSGFGLSTAIILKSKQLFGKRIISSSNKKNHLSARKIH